MATNAPSCTKNVVAPRSIKAIKFGLNCFLNTTVFGVVRAEVLPTHRRQGVGSQLVRELLDQLDGIYMVDLICDADVQPFYQALGLQPSSGMIRRNYGAQGGLPPHAV